MERSVREAENGRSQCTLTSRIRHDLVRGGNLRLDLIGPIFSLFSLEE